MSVCLASQNIEMSRQDKHTGVYLTVAKVVTVCHFLIRSQIEYVRGQLYVEWTRIHCSIYADISMLSVTPSGLIYECCTLALSMGTEPVGLYKV